MAQRPRPTRPPQRAPARRSGPAPRSSSLPPRRNPPRRGRFGIWLLIIVLMVAGLGYVIYDRTFGVISSMAGAEDVRNKPESEGPPPPLLQAPFNVLLIGVDAREGLPEEGVRSDTLIVVHVDPLAKWASMLSIPRDSYVRIPYRDDIDGTKITLAYSWGFQNPDIYGSGTEPAEAGQALAAETVEAFLGIKIDYTAQVDHLGFEKLVDAMNGITIDVPHTILDAEYPTEDFGYMRLLIEPGLQRMDGATALQFARTRHADSDFGRSQRQQMVLQAALNELRQRDLLGQIEAVPRLLEALRESVLTTMPLDDISTLRGMARLAQEIGVDRIQRFVMNPDTVALDQNFDNLGDIHWNPADVRAIAQQFQGGPAQSAVAQAPETATIQVQNGRGIIGLAGQLSLDLQLAGYTLADPADAPTDENPNTLILDYSGKPETRARLAEYFKISPEFVRDELANQAEAPFGVDIVVRIGADYDPAAIQP